MATKRKTKKTATKKLEFVIVRSRDAGVHAGFLLKRTNELATLKDSRRIWYWKGAASLSELAVYGAKFPDGCRFGVKLPKLEIGNWCEIIVCQPAGAKMIREQAEWRA